MKKLMLTVALIGSVFCLEAQTKKLSVNFKNGKMKSLSKIILFGLILSILTSCAATKSYERAITTNSISALEKVLTDFPRSKHKQDLYNRLQVLYDERDWEQALSSNTIDGFKNYMLNYPNGKYVEQAKSKIKKIEIYHAWNKATLENTIEGYQTFIDLYPDSSYVNEAKYKISILQEEMAWQKALDDNTTESYSEYLEAYPYGKYSSIAQAKIKTLHEEKYILPIWNEVARRNTYQAYSDFKAKYPESSYAKSAQEKMIEIETRDWNKTCKISTMKSYKDFIKKYPSGEYFEIAEGKIIDLEVDKIFQGDHGEHPAMEKSAPVYHSYSSTSFIDLYNDTQYTLTIRYSGVESKKIVLSPKERTVITLKNGEYRVAASVNALTVTNYAGYENPTGGNYSSNYYIKNQALNSLPLPDKIYTPSPKSPNHPYKLRY